MFLTQSLTQRVVRQGAFKAASRTSGLVLARGFSRYTAAKQAMPATQDPLSPPSGSQIGHY